MGDPKGFMTHTRRAPKYLPATLRLKNHEEHIEILPADSNFAHDNTASRLLAKLLELPAPGTGWRRRPSCRPG